MKLSLNRNLIQRLGFGLITLMMLITIIPIIALIVYILVRGAPAISWEFLTGFPRDGMRQGGILPAIIGPFYLTLGTAIFSVPLGVAAAIYLSQYAPANTVTRLTRRAIISRPAVPLAVYG